MIVFYIAKCDLSIIKEKSELYNRRGWVDILII